MPIIHVEISDDTYKVLNMLPKQVRGKFVESALAHFLKTTEGQTIVSFVSPNATVGSGEATVGSQKGIEAAQYPNLDDWTNSE